MHDSLATTAGVSAAYDQWVIRFRAALIGTLGALVAGISAIAYLVSFEAISVYAMHSGGIAPKYAWAAPLLVDSFIAVATGADLWFAIGPRQRQWWELLWPKLLLAGAALVSFVLNIAHAKHTWAARGVAALAPAALVLSVELLMLVVRRAAALRAARLSAAAEPPTTATASVAADQPTAASAHAGGLTVTDPSARPPGADGSQSGPGVAAGGRRQRLSAEQMRAARAAARAVFAAQDGHLTGRRLQAALQERGLPVSERACFGLLRELRDDPASSAGDADHDRPQAADAAPATGLDQAHPPASAAT